MTSTSEGKPVRLTRRYARSTKSVAVCAHLWPDVMDLIRQHLRRYFNLPTIN
jgi:hypothetical protein